MSDQHIPRRGADRIRRLLEQFPAVGLVGPRQVGKTDLARRVLAPDAQCIHLDLEDPSDLQRLSDPLLYFSSLPDARFVIDEVQRLPELFSALRVVIDRDRRPGRFLLLGSASPELLRRSADSLAGRIAYVRLHPFDLSELASQEDTLRLWNRGGFPLSFLAAEETHSREWRRHYLASLVERDLPLLGLSTSPTELRRFLTMLAHVHGQLLNKSALSRNMGWTLPNVDRHLEVLQSAYLIRLVAAWHANLGKRLVRAPKVFLADSGLLHALLGIPHIEALLGHPSVGASWEGFVLQQLDALCTPEDELAHYRTQDGTEADLLWVRHGKPLALFECKGSSAPRLSKGNTVAANDLDVQHRFVVSPVSGAFPQREGFVVVPPFELADRLAEL